MVVTVTPKNYLQLGKCDDLSDISGTWTGNSAGTEGDFFKEGIGCLGFTIRTVGNNDILYTKTSGTWDLSGIKHLRIWFLCSTPNSVNVDDPADPANAGVQFFVGDATNTAYYKVSGRTSYPGGWYNLVVDLSRTADSGTKPTGMLCTKVGIRMNMTAAPKNVDNVWIDNLIYCDGLIAYGDDAGSPFDLQDVYDKDNATTGAWGIIRKISDVYCLTGSLTFGDAGSNNCTFKDINQVAVFESRKINVALYEIAIVMGSGTTKFYLGSESGGAGISGCTIKSISTSTPFKITATAAITEFGLYGSTFDTHGVVDLAPAATNRAVLNSNFSNGQGQVQPNTMKVENSNFVSCAAAVDGYVLIESVSHGVKNCNFINNPNATEFESALSVTFDGLEFIGNTIDVNNTSGGAVIVDSVNADNPPSQSKVTGNTTINVSVYLTIYVADEAGNPVIDAQCAIYDSTPTELMNEDTVLIEGKAVAQETYNYEGVEAIIFRVRKSTSGVTRYFPVSGTGEIGADGFTAYVTLVQDKIALP